MTVSLTRRRFARIAPAGAAAMALSGCGAASGLLRPDPPALYALTPKSTFDPDLPQVSWQLLVESPVASAGLDTSRIAVMRSALRLDYYASVAWTTRAPEMVQTLLIESFENSRRIVAVGREAVGLRADYVLRTEIREFQAELHSGTAPQVRVRINAKLVKVPQRNIIGSETIERTETFAEDRFDSTITAFDEALGKVLRRVVEWTLRTGQADWVQRSQARP